MTLNGNQESDIELNEPCRCPSPQIFKHRSSVRVRALLNYDPLMWMIVGHFIIFSLSLAVRNLIMSILELFIYFLYIYFCMYVQGTRSAFLFQKVTCFSAGTLSWIISLIIFLLLNSLFLFWEIPMIQILDLPDPFSKYLFSSPIFYPFHFCSAFWEISSQLFIF